MIGMEQQNPGSAPSPASATRSHDAGPHKNQSDSQSTPDANGAAAFASPAVVTLAPAASQPTHLSRAQIMDVTARCLSEKGYDGTTIRQIASMLDCAVGSIYRYFRDKRELLDAVTQQNLLPVTQLIDTGGSLERSFVLYHQRATHDVSAYQLMFWLSAVQAPKAVTQPIVPGIIARIVQGWASQLNDASLAQECWATLHASIVAGFDQAAAMASVERTLARTLAATMTAGVSDRTLSDTRPTAPMRTALPVTIVAASQPRQTQTVKEADDVCLL
jgi:AcrR family transcriptional regulator